MKSALTEMEHSLCYPYAHHNQSLLYNTTTDAIKKTIHTANYYYSLLNTILNIYGT